MLGQGSRGGMDRQEKERRCTPLVAPAGQQHTAAKHSGKSCSAGWEENARPQMPQRAWQRVRTVHGVDHPCGCIGQFVCESLQQQMGGTWSARNKQEKRTMTIGYFVLAVQQSASKGARSPHLRSPAATCVPRAESVGILLRAAAQHGSAAGAHDTACHTEAAGLPAPRCPPLQ